MTDLFKIYLEYRINPIKIILKANEKEMEKIIQSTQCEYIGEYGMKITAIGFYPTNSKPPELKNLKLL